MKRSGEDLWCKEKWQEEAAVRAGIWLRVLYDSGRWRWAEIVLEKNEFFHLTRANTGGICCCVSRTGRFVLSEAGGYPISVSAVHMQARQLTDKSYRTRVVCLQAFIEGREWHGVKSALIGPVNRNKKAIKEECCSVSISVGLRFLSKRQNMQMFSRYRSPSPPL